MSDFFAKSFPENDRFEQYVEDPSWRDSDNNKSGEGEFFDTSFKVTPKPGVGMLDANGLRTDQKSSRAIAEDYLPADAKVVYGKTFNVDGSSLSFDVDPYSVSLFETDTDPLIVKDRGGNVVGTARPVDSNGGSTTILIHDSAGDYRYLRVYRDGQIRSGKDRSRLPVFL